ncbi:exosortase A [Altericroceibacterium spongiae]|uniref:Exosortase A n=1 Tax=Altericroceibacterium spongiae TaxID=2320269 RepID=A0A420ERD6_9SPHN|nr:exosortase A [Altericroceibacterium spongiae]RKF23245.1 exosortase A [Altericroceibacterium spongiae]
MANGSSISHVQLGRLAFIPIKWQGPLLRLLLAWIGLIALFFRDWAVMVGQWWNSSSYNHILLIPLILIWLVWLRWPELRKLVPFGWWPGLLFLAAAALIWMLGAVSGLNLLMQVGIVGMLIASVMVFLGPCVAAGLFFPLCYMALLVPFGEELVPTLQLVTARLAIALTHWSGVPAYVEGVFIDTPVGLFEVAEACSGVKFLIAMAALGLLVAHVCFQSWWRRVTFMTVAVILPIIANGVRAWGTIYVAQFKGVEFAAGFDHIFYGWIFFGLIMALLLGIGWHFFDRPGNDSFIHAEAITKSPLLRRFALWRMAGWRLFAISMIVVGSVHLWTDHIMQLEADLPVQISLPSVSGWHRVDYKPSVWWEPRAAGADHRLLGSYADNKGHQLDVFVALYAKQEDGREAGGYGEGALTPGTIWRWLEPGAPVQGAKADWLQANGQTRRLAMTWYRTGDVLTGSNSRLKLANIKNRLLGRDKTTMTLILSAEDRPNHSAGAAIMAFRDAIMPLEEWMDDIAQNP